MLKKHRITKFLRYRILTKFENKLGKSQCHHILETIGLKLAEVLSRADKNFHLAAAVEGQKLEWFPRRRNLSTALSSARPSPQQHRLRLEHRQISREGETPGHSRWKNPVSGGPFIICRRNAPGQVYRSLSLSPINKIVSE